MLQCVTVVRRSTLDNTVGELNSRNRSSGSGSLFDTSPVNVSSLAEGRETAVNGHQQLHDTSSEPDDQSSYLVYIYVLKVQS